MIIKKITRDIKLSKAGKPYASIGIQFDEYRDGKGNHVWINGFGNKFTWAWKVGDDVQPEINKNDRGYYNFSFRDEKENSLDVYKLGATVGFVLELLKGRSTPAPQQRQSTMSPEAQAIDYPTDEIDPADIPF